MTTHQAAAPADERSLPHRSWRLAADYAHGAGEGWWIGTENVMRRWSRWWSAAATNPREAALFPWELSAHQSRYWQEVWRRAEPTWATPNEIALENPFARLRDFSAGVTSGAPVLLLPPQAGHASTVVDYAPDQSQVQTLRAAGLPRVFVCEWRSATAETKNTTIDDYMRFMREAVAKIGEPVHLIGDCQGGWQATIYAALFPEDVRTLTLAGAPIDFQAGDGAIKNWVNVLCGSNGMTFFNSVIAANNGMIPGSAILNGFSLINPQQDYERYSGLFANLDNPAFLSRHQGFETWYQHTQNIPGRFYLWLVENLFWRNRLVEGTLTVLGRTVDLRRINQPLALLAGSRDHITPDVQVFGILPHVSTPPEQVLELTADGGHLGLFMGSSALGREWPLVAEHIRRFDEAQGVEISTEVVAGIAPPPVAAVF